MSWAEDKPLYRVIPEPQESEEEKPIMDPDTFTDEEDDDSSDDSSNEDKDDDDDDGDDDKFEDEDDDNGEEVIDPLSDEPDSPDDGPVT